MCLKCHHSCSRNMVLPEMSGLIAMDVFAISKRRVQRFVLSVVVMYRLRSRFVMS